MPDGPLPEIFAQAFGDLTEVTFVASGGQKSVYSARDRNGNRVALKLFNVGADRVRFEREIDAVKRIPNDRVPVINAFGAITLLQATRLWVVEQWIDGETLRTHLDRGRIDNSLILKIAADILSVLIDAEKSKIVHRDVKPENILLASTTLNCWLLDFGIARHLDLNTLTQGPWGLFSAGYSPIEQFKNICAEIDSRSDLFALGVTLHECVEGSNFFRKDTGSPQDILERVETVPLPPVSRHIDACCQFRDLVAAMTRPKRIHRISTVAEANDWMREIIAGGAA